MLRQIELCDSDHLYILGDVIDRGPDSISILEDIMRRKNVTMLLGNHEHMMLDAIFHPEDDMLSFRWESNGAYPTYQSFCSLAKKNRKPCLTSCLVFSLRLSSAATGNPIAWFTLPLPICLQNSITGIGMKQRSASGTGFGKKIPYQLTRRSFSAHTHISIFPWPAGFHMEQSEPY